MPAQFKVKHVPQSEPVKYVVEHKGVVVSLPAKWPVAYADAYWQARMLTIIQDALPINATAEVIAAEAWEGFNDDCD